MNNLYKLEQQFTELLSFIENKRGEASQAVNEKQLQTAWTVGGYVSAKLKSEEWGSKVVTQFAEYVKVHAPHLKGYTRRNIYNFVMLYDEYSSPQFLGFVRKYLADKYVQEERLLGSEIVQSEIAQMGKTEIVQLPSGQIVQFEIAQLPPLIKLTTYTNHLTRLFHLKIWGIIKN